MGNEFVEAALVEFEVTEKNVIVYKLINEYIITQKDLNELREIMGKLAANKLHTALCRMRKVRLKLNNA